jgi:hypothetical protein
MSNCKCGKCGDNPVRLGFDCYGNVGGTILDDIKAGDKVEYVTAYTKKLPNGRGEYDKKTLTGIWDGDKVEFNDKERTIVRTIHWLKLVK